MLDTQPIVRVFFIFSRLDVDTALSVLPAATAIRFSDIFKQDLFGSPDILLKILNRLLPLIWLRHWVLRLFNNSLATCLKKTTHFAIIMMILYQGPRMIQYAKKNVIIHLGCHILLIGRRVMVDLQVPLIFNLQIF